MPFEQVFESAVEGWVNGKYDIAAGMLKSRITEESELWRVLGDVHGVYCMLYHESMMLFTQLLFQKVTFPVYPFRFFLWCNSGVGVDVRWINRLSGEIDMSLQTTYKNRSP